MKKALVIMFLFLLTFLSDERIFADYHSADYNPADYEVGLAELLRVIQLYNSGSYHCDSDGEDGYAPGNGSTNCTPHDSDYNPQDWSVGLNELLRIIQFYNSGGYHSDIDGEDNFSPGKELISELGVFSMPSQSIITFELRWWGQGTDLDLYVKNPKGEFCYWENNTTNWGAIHESGYFYESITIDVDIMDCYASGNYEFHVYHVAGQSVMSTITTSYGQSESFTTSQGDDKYVFYYPSDQSRCQPKITYPSPGETLTSSRVRFTWTSGADYYYLQIGSNNAQQDIFDSGTINDTSVLVSGLPSDGTTLYVRLWWYRNGNWNYQDYTYKSWTYTPSSWDDEPIISCEDYCRLDNAVCRGTCQGDSIDSCQQQCDVELTNCIRRCP